MPVADYLEDFSDVEIEDNRQPSKSVSYPNSIGASGEEGETHSNFLIFNAVKPLVQKGDMRSSALRERRQAFIRGNEERTGSNLKEETLALIQLYVPAMQENTSHSYERSDTSFFSEIASSLIKDIGTMGDEDFSVGMDGMKPNVGGGFSKLTSGGTTMEALQRKGADIIREPIIRTVGKIYGERTTGMYKETEMRNHTFSFQLRPRDLNELRSIGTIIHYFRKFSSAEVVGSEGSGDQTTNTLRVPPIWYVEERSRDGDLPRYIPKFKFGPAVITGVEVNKTPDQMYQSFKQTGGDPIAVDMTINMQEIIPVYADFWKLADSDIEGVK